MPELRRVGDLEIDQDLELLQRSWKMQHYAWAALAALLLAALLGVFGSGGWLASGSAGEQPLRAEYQRFLRRQSSSILKVRVAAPAAGAGELRLWMSRDYADRFTFEDISPRPQATTPQGQRVLFQFSLPASGEEAQITFSFKPRDAGRVHAELGLTDGPQLRFWQFIYP